MSITKWDSSVVEVENRSIEIRKRLQEIKDIRKLLRIEFSNLEKELNLIYSNYPNIKPQVGRPTGWRKY